MELCRGKLKVKAGSLTQDHEPIRKAQQFVPYRSVVAECTIKQLGVKRFGVRSATQEAIDTVKCEYINILGQDRRACCSYQGIESHDHGVQAWFILLIWRLQQLRHRRRVMTSKIGHPACLVDPRRKMDGLPIVYCGSQCSSALFHAMIVKLSFYPIPYASQLFLFLTCAM
jgi:hypothetical protein